MLDSLSPATLWWLLAGLLVLAELLTGTTFYLLMLALGAVAGALAAHLGLAATAQMLGAAVVGGAAVALWHWRRAQRGAPVPAAANPDVNLDVGQTVHVTHWQADGSAVVQYRGSAWQAQLQSGAPAQAGVHTIVAVQSNHLVLAPSQP